MGILDAFQNKNQFIPYLNTGTIYDLATGRYVSGKDGKWYLNGGLSMVVGVMGRGQTFKSGLAGSLMANTMNCYPEAEASVLETEFTIADAQRYDDFVPGAPVSNRIVFNNRLNMNISDYFEHLKEIGEAKLQMKKDLMVESPFIDPMTGKPHKCWIPTISHVDSWSKAASGKEEASFEQNKMDSSDMNTLYMQEGMVKTRIMRAIPTLAAKYGIYVIMTAHVGNKIDMDPYNKAPKQLQYMKGTDKMKNVGAEFEFLTSTLLQTTGVTNLKDKEGKNSFYPLGRGGLTEINEVTGVVVRCKNNASGCNIPFIVSQYQGILNAVTNYHICKKNKNFGFIESGRSDVSPLLTPEKTLNRMNIREITSKDKELCRALEILAQICFIQNYWSSYGMPEYVYTPVKKIAEYLTTSTSPTVSDILNSTSTWYYGKRDVPYFSAMDILELVHKGMKK